MNPRLVLVLLGFLAALGFGVGLASSSGAAVTGVVIGKDPAGDVQGKGLTKAERDALDIVSVRVTGASDLGVFVTVTFRGDFQKAIGRGHLVNAAAALVLRSDPKVASSAGLISTGSGKVGRVFRATKSTAVGAYRNGKRLTFFILGPGFGNVRTVTVETVRNAGKLPSSRTTSAATDSPPYMEPRRWTEFIGISPVDHLPTVADPAGLSCQELRGLLGNIDTELAGPFYTANSSSSLTLALIKLQAAVKALLDTCAGPPTLHAIFAWSVFSPVEVAGTGKFTGPKGTLNALKIVVPPTFTITNHLCPSQLPDGAISGNTIVCGGGTLTIGQPFTLNLQTSPNPSAGMGGQLFGEENGAFEGPFPITGP